MVGLRQNLPSCISAVAATRVDDIKGFLLETFFSSKEEGGEREETKASFDVNLGFQERALSAAGAAVISAIVVNPLDVAKTRLQAQAAGLLYQDLSDMACFQTNPMLAQLKCTRAVRGSEPPCTSQSKLYKGTLDVFYRIICQEGFGRLWRGTNPSLALAVPTIKSVARSLACVTCYPVELPRTRMRAFRDIKNGVKHPGVWRMLIEAINPVRDANNLQKLRSYRILWTGLRAQLSRDVPSLQSAGQPLNLSGGEYLMW